MADFRLASLVYVSTYCVPIALLRQNKPFQLLYLGHAQIIRKLSWKHLHLQDELHTFPNHTSLVNLFSIKTHLRFPWKVHWNMSKTVVVHCICTLVRSVAVSYSVITIQVMLRFVITKKSKFLAFIWLVPLLKYPLRLLRELKYLNY